MALTAQFLAAITDVEYAATDLGTPRQVLYKWTLLELALENKIGELRKFCLQEVDNWRKTGCRETGRIRVAGACQGGLRT